LAGCSSAPPPAPTKAPAAPARWEGSGLRVALSEVAKSVCVSEQGCATGPKGAVSIKPLEPKLKQAISDALVTAGFELVQRDAERDMLADVEWHGTDTIALKLQDVHGRLIDEASYRRNLSHCRDLTDTSWDGCWAANFDAMKTELLRPLRQSPKLKSFALKARAGDEASPGLGAKSNAGASSADGARTSNASLPERLDDATLTATLARHQDELERACFQPAFDARSDGASSSARVSTVITVQPSGQVESVTTSGDPPGYLHLASCVAARVRGFRFPAARGVTSAKVPFIFAAE
jgi:hypothetical protein